MDRDRKEPKTESSKSKFKDLYGAFSKYANPELRKREDTAWSDAVQEKYKLK